MLLNSFNCENLLKERVLVKQISAYDPILVTCHKNKKKLKKIFLFVKRTHIYTTNMLNHPTSTTGSCYQCSEVQ